MEVEILDSIIHGSLKPWKLDTSKTSRLIELIKASKSGMPHTNGELLLQLKTILTDFPVEQKKLGETVIPTPLRPLLCKIDLPKYRDVPEHFYYLIISGGTLRLFNDFLHQARTWTEQVDISYHVAKTLKNIKVLAKQVSIELNEQGFIGAPNDETSVAHFAMYYLKYSLVQLYFSIQEQFKISLDHVIMPEDFYLLDLEESASNMLPIEFIEPLEKSSAGQNSGNDIRDKITFGFTGDKSKLKEAIIQLCQKIDLLNQDKTSIDDFQKTLITKNLEADCKKIYLACETTQFRYVIDKIALQFTNLKLKTVERTRAFYSKNGTLITAQNLSAGKVANPKEKAAIDNILKSL